MVWLKSIVLFGCRFVCRVCCALGPLSPDQHLISHQVSAQRSPGGTSCPTNLASSCLSLGQQHLNWPLPGQSASRGLAARPQALSAGPCPVANGPAFIPLLPRASLLGGISTYWRHELPGVVTAAGNGTVDSASPAQGRLEVEAPHCRRGLRVQ